MNCKPSLRLLTIGFALTAVQRLSAKCGNVDYSWGADGLAYAHDYVVSMMLYVLFLRFGVIQEHTKPNARTFTMPYK